ncbi:hypothetical protein B0H21DRAFT_757168 [Amylocystis lapponica]|nr:hypothetical protein B0H21DRAFT_757168 [Amylocystis lapponica]
MLLLDFPPELFVRILLFLPLSDLATCQRVNRTVNDTIQSSVELQYSIELAAAGAEDDTSSPLVLADRLRLLRARETAWGLLDFSRVTTIPVCHRPSSIYDLTSGLFLLGETFVHHRLIQKGTDALRTIRLPCSQEGEGREAGEEAPSWSKISLEASVIDIGLAVQEHDLIAVVTYKFLSDNSAIEIHLLQLSTGQYHPLASQAVLLVPDLPFIPGRCGVSIEIVGDTLGILFNLGWLLDAPYRAVFHTFNWKSGKERQFRYAPHGGQFYNAFAFLSADVIVLPDLSNNTLELCRLRDDNEPGLLPLCTMCVLQLPSLSDSSILYRMWCRSEPNPMGSTTRYGSDGEHPFRSNAADAIVAFSLYILHHDGESHSFSLIVHRSALLAQVPGDVSASGSPRSQPPVVLWDHWGPPVCRWFDTRDIVTRWITTTCGQRYVVTMRHLPAFISVLDFNQKAIRRRPQEEQLGTRESRSGNGVCARLAVDRLWSPVFKDIVHSCLPYIVTTTAQKYDYECVLIDEERLIGLKLDGQQKNIAELVVHQL